MERQMILGWMRGSALLTMSLGPWLQGCGGPGDEVEIATTRTASASERPVVPRADSAARFGRGGSQSSPHTATARGPELAWDLPPGWTEVAPTAERIANLRVGPDESGECYVSVLGGSGGGLRANVDRWRDQMGLAPSTDEEFANLTTRRMLEQDATFVEFDGSFTAMGAEPRAGYRMYGQILALPEAAFFVKMVGPQGLLQAERENFLAFCDSLHLEERQAADPDPHAGLTNSAAAAASTEGPLRWVTPLGWQEPSSWQRIPSPPMLKASFRLGEAAASECSITIMEGNAGGLVPNMNRWRQQLGLAPLTPAEIDQLERVALLAAEVPLLEAYGAYTGMSGESIADAGMLAVAHTLGGAMIFVKLIGSAADVRNAKVAFTEFCASLEML